MNKMDALASVERQRDKLGAILSKWAIRPNEIEDVIQRTYLQIFRAAGDEIENPFAYFFIVAKRIISEDRKAARWKMDQHSTNHPKATSALISSERTPYEQLEVEQAYVLFMRRCAVMSERRRTIYLMSVIGGYTYAEIATQFQMTESGVKQHLTDAKKVLAMNRDEFNRAKAMYEYARTDRIKAQEALKRAEADETARAQELATQMLKATAQVAA